MRIAIFDYKVIPNNPIGGCHRRMLEALCQMHEFTVFAVQFDNPNPNRIRWVRIPAPTRPLALLYLVYHVLAPLYYLVHRWRSGERFDLIQVVESNLSFGDVAYAHFCHRAFLERYWKQVGARGTRGWLRWLDHRLHALVEPWLFKRVRSIVVPSEGLARELRETYPGAARKIHVLPNAVDTVRMRRPAEIDTAAFHREWGFTAEDRVLLFGALGHFERKGLPLLLDAMQRLGDARLKLLVVGGEPDLVASYQRRAANHGLARSVRFAGAQEDVRPFLWAADCFVLPSLYETFSLVTAEAAAAGCPVIVTRLHGVEEFVSDPSTGFVIERSVAGVLEGLRRFLALSPDECARMGTRAATDVSRYSIENFRSAWQVFYTEMPC